MAKPTRHGDKWRIRWLDAAGKRQSAVFEDFKTAQIDLGRRIVEAEEVKEGLRDPDPGRRTFDELCTYWLEKRAPRKRSRKDDESIIRKHLRPHFGTMCVRDIGVEEGDDYLNLKIDGEGLSDKYIHNHVTLLGTMLRVAASFKVPWIARMPKLHPATVRTKNLKRRAFIFGRFYRSDRNARTGAKHGKASLNRLG